MQKAQAADPGEGVKQLNREAIAVARCTVARLMRGLGLRGAVRGRAWTHTTIADQATERPSDLVARQR